MAIELIYCADGNRRFAEIAINAGFLYGAQMPRHVYFQPFFCDQDWKKPDRKKYMAALAKHRPYLASVLDWERDDQYGDVMKWAEEAAMYVSEVMVIPKVCGTIDRIPEVIGGKRVRIGYSVPTKYGGSFVPLWEFGRRPIHLLGGSPNKQFELTYYLNVVSVDGNYTQMMASRYNEFWMDGSWHELNQNGIHYEKDAIYEAFSRSCQNVMEAWQRLQPCI